MPQTTLTSKGQMTLPKDVREKFNLNAGDRLDVVVEDERIVLVPATIHLDQLAKILPAPRKSATLDDMERTIRRRAAERAR